MKKNTKKTLLFSVLALILCCAMLIGTTFAWFTDNASTAVNKIQAGTLQIGLYSDEACTTSVEGKTLSFTQAGENVLWEPGCTWTLPTVYIKNEGNLALKYNVQVTGIDGDAKLNEVIDWDITTGIANNAEDGHLLKDQVAEINISGHMQESAGNEYQGLTIDGIAITVIATQDAVEYDSTDNTYDAAAEYDTAIVTATELAAVMTPDENGVINLEKNYVVTSAWTSLDIIGALTINGNGHTITGLTQPLVKGRASDITIKDLTINASSIGIAAFENGLGTGAFVSFLDGANGTFSNCHLVNSSVTGKEERAAGIVSYSSGTTLEIEDCTVENCEIKAVGGAGGLVGYSTATTTITNSSVKKTSVTSTEDRLGTKTPLAGGVIGTVGGATTFTNVTVADVTVSNNNASVAVHSDLIGRIAGDGSITTN